MSRRYQLTLAEQETIVNYDNELSNASIYTHDPRMIRKLKELAEKYPEQFILKSKGMGKSVIYEFPKRCLGIRPPYSEVRKKQQAENARVNGLPFLNQNMETEENKDGRNRKME